MDIGINNNYNNINNNLDMKKSTKQAILGASVFSIIGGISAYVAGESGWVVILPTVVGVTLAYFAIDNR